MESLITGKTDDELHEDALKEDIERTEVKEALEDKVAQESQQQEILRIDLPIDYLLGASRKDKKEFFSNLIKNIKVRIEVHRQERRLKQ